MKPIERLTSFNNCVLSMSQVWGMVLKTWGETMTKTEMDPTG